MHDITLKTVDDVTVHDVGDRGSNSSLEGHGKEPKVSQSITKSDVNVFEVSFSYIHSFNGMLNFDSDISTPPQLSTSGSRCKLPGSATQCCSKSVCLMAVQHRWFMGASCRV
jgi:hypothetical protein